MTVHQAGTVTHDDLVLRMLEKRPGMDASYLQTALDESGEPGGFGALLDAMLHVVIFRGIDSIAEKVGVSKRHLLDVLSSDEGPPLKEFAAVIDALGMRVTLRPAESPAPKPPKRRSEKNDVVS